MISNFLMKIVRSISRSFFRIITRFGDSTRIEGTAFKISKNGVGTGISPLIIILGGYNNEDKQYNNDSLDLDKFKCYDAIKKSLESQHFFFRGSSQLEELSRLIEEEYRKKYLYYYTPVLIKRNTYSCDQDVLATNFIAPLIIEILKDVERNFLYDIEDLKVKNKKIEVRLIGYSQGGVSAASCLEYIFSNLKRGRYNIKLGTISSPVAGSSIIDDTGKIFKKSYIVFDGVKFIGDKLNRFTDSLKSYLPDLDFKFELSFDQMRLLDDYDVNKVAGLYCMLPAVCEKRNTHFVENDYFIGHDNILNICTGLENNREYCFAQGLPLARLFKFTGTHDGLFREVEQVFGGKVKKRLINGNHYYPLSAIGAKDIYNVLDEYGFV